MATPIITPENFNAALLGKAPPRAPGKGKASNALFKVSYNGVPDPEFQFRGSMCRAYPSYYDSDAPGYNGKKGAFLSKPAAQVPVQVTQFKLNFDLRGARRAFHRHPDATAEDHYQLSVVRMISDVELFIMNNCREDLRKTNPRMPAGEFDVSPWFNSCLVGTPVADNPFYVDEKTKEQRLAPLTLSLTVYAKDRSMAGEPIIIDSAQCFSIDGWEQNQDYPNDPSRRKPKLSNGDFFTHCVGGASGYAVFIFGQPNIYSGKISAAPRPKNVFMDISTKWGQGHHIDAEEAAQKVAIEWKWTLREMIEKMLCSPGSQFNIYMSDQIPPGRQREVVSYKSGMTRGSVRRSTMSQNRGQLVPTDRLYDNMAYDCEVYRNLFYTFMAAPVYGLASTSENRSYRNNFESLYPLPIVSILP